MKKHLIAAAVAAAVAVPAMAQNVTVYGRLDAGYTSLDVKPAATALNVAGMTVGGTGKTQGIAYGIDQTALWGLRGTEDLGGGLKANFVIESGIGGSNTNVATAVAASGNGATGQTFSNPTNLGSRLLYASLSNAGGTEVRIGYQSSFVRDVGVGFAADGATNVTGNIVAGAFAPRHNAITLLQSAGSLQFGASVSRQTTNTNVAGASDTDVGSGYALTARYSAGPLSAQIAYMNNDNGVQAAATKNEKSTTIAGASYNFGAAQAYVQYATMENETGTAANQPEASVWNVGVRVPMGNLGLFASVSGGDNRSTAGGYKGDVEGYNIGARYNLSKRTNAYAIYGKTEIDTSGSTSTEAKQFAVGVTHVF